MGSRTAHSAFMRAAALLAALLGMPWAGLSVARAAEPQIRSIDIEVTLHRDGSASFTEDWDVTVTEGTEWYLVRQNLDGMEVSGLSVTDETGRRYADIGEWDIDRSMAEKAGKSGIRHSGDGVELCWGVGGYGDHRYSVSYRMSRAVRALDDYDYLHMQLVSPGLSSAPQAVAVSIGCDFAQLDTASVRAWGFGFAGECSFSDGRVIYSGTEPFRHESSVIALLRFDKGLFSPTAGEAGSFDEVLDRALEGSDYEDDGPAFAVIILIMLAAFLIPILLTVAARAVRRRQILGMKPKDVGWCRDIPFRGSLAESAYVCTELGLAQKRDTIAAALILRMIHLGILNIGKDSRGRVELSFTGRRPAEDDRVALGLYEMMREASGSDSVLQEKEFSKWAKKHLSKVAAWTKLCGRQGLRALAADGYATKSGRFLPEGQAEARKLAGLKNFLLDFSLTGEREAAEVSLWKEYLVFGALLGIADKVAEQLRDIRPELFTEAQEYDYPTLEQVILRSMLLSRAITNSSQAYAAQKAGRSSGLGGGTSFGGGGGFRGGGFGGGSR